MAKPKRFQVGIEPHVAYQIEIIAKAERRGMGNVVADGFEYYRLSEAFKERLATAIEIRDRKKHCVMTAIRDLPPEKQAEILTAMED